MSRLLAWPFALALAATAAATPVPRDALPTTPDPVYYPTRVGAKRAMGVNGRVMKTYTVTVADPQPDGSVRVYEQSESRGVPFPFQEVLSVSPKGVFWTGIVRNEDGKDIRDVRVTPKWEPECLVRPEKARWEWSLLDPARFPQAGRRVRTYEAVGVERVVVPAGTFRAMRVEQSTRDEANPADFRRTAWYAPGVGVVQTAINGRTLEQLLSFEPGPIPAKGQ
ncbi:hypothetical protein [Cylindrospermum sp. FACHB-282]|uniref:hypothetical protein n=1 Tax=Cylindrospermum sp. FACHB-282 TaxID=2692794 RepID=UPI0016862BEE|nr:hypothetical protein [Cylindrospermum sp. FACHB-282]MBD2388827.1 hypothetical protein [Cylindrospermum sp. FACHB-282]